MKDKGEFSDEDLKDLLLEAYLEVEKEQVEKGVLPRGDQHILARFRGFFEFLGAIHVGLFLACLTILGNFVVVRMIFHLDLGRYFG